MNLQDQILTRVAKKMQAAIDEAVMESWKYKPNFKIYDESVVDGATWYTVGCYDDTSEWLRSQDHKLWYEHIVTQMESGYYNTFDIHEKLYTMLALKWT